MVWMNIKRYAIKKVLRVKSRTYLNIGGASERNQNPVKGSHGSQPTHVFERTLDDHHNCEPHLHSFDEIDKKIKAIMLTAL